MGVPYFGKLPSYGYVLDLELAVQGLGFGFWSLGVGGLGLKVISMSGFRAGVCLGLRVFRAVAKELNYSTTLPTCG